MQIGVAAFITEDGIDPVQLARAVEDRGLAALFVTEHTHIPVNRRSPWPGGGELPREYSHTFDPFVALGAMAAVTESIVLGTAVTLVNQRHPITLAKQVASVERLAPGRVELGVGPGWNAEEMRNHGVDPRWRTARMLDHLDAVRTLWAQDEAEHHGEFVDFDPVWCWPKPTAPVPVLIAGTGPTVLDRVLSHGDGWLPLRIPRRELGSFGNRIAELRSRAAETGRCRIPVTLYGGMPERSVAEDYAAAGVDRLLITLTGSSGADPAPPVLAELDIMAELAEHTDG
ncbi:MULTISPECIES: LLM class F420-dependent oxidoreductase [Pseudonocardia]|uniref:F420-dependent glucose-6-phosphate dehydrogenase n=2 Tax=Pseudonocardia TaxID=1847 RepID=A0A1Y2MI40_PSEAH|nr:MULTISPECIES: LLM class F420-dependent oxidoreductase [Pseudonocardia]OSY34367.1 F420-dependent glucose-6-phosphate dehydrogenase [Pseudonocardia autotrophica]TDN75424.1 putative F420-dependent oxidoreductase [Pseudonocardia autotrophica]BBF99382.1 LLM class F420-dependent oxidoreductase [Pseudonocardia autotrophica]GEC29802.1 LLM class F420-dependent oxidoreductase [Pseudonocardia saturnea]